jgi:hypothetical protein
MTVVKVEGRPARESMSSRLSPPSVPRANDASRWRVDGQTGCDLPGRYLRSRRTHRGRGHGIQSPVGDATDVARFERERAMPRGPRAHTGCGSLAARSIETTALRRRIRSTFDTGHPLPAAPAGGLPPRCLPSGLSVHATDSPREMGRFAPPRRGFRPGAGCTKRGRGRLKPGANSRGADTLSACPDMSAGADDRRAGAATVSRRLIRLPAGRIRHSRRGGRRTPRSARPPPRRAAARRVEAPLGRRSPSSRSGP